ncbi:beta-ketoacyl-ACP synthase I [Halothiobacillus neapolitanus]|uniref:3-oxoacyl-[acyl-carrier-protein] synthase 1 n=1 Tax=Halothiobacillus neapolitanus (strain ATCC 23641 / DSM 15147 / CIP 104769 / NCIMB 8539 / c2) TaxID=555778 RepID=D0KZE6_HALNC|nr:beta-ketoacyl-ACP synthase I [Halothiobacillus neapolitanus]ACX95819.1 Beta-ketoacyl synthase [Halothiobacillus neapolitanus c2]TDN66130.1 3-oxoacyl-[acyl-carrier-protein] synthase I [Halothiobacillus neapolitanus]
MRRVVITGMGIVSSIGNNQKEVLDSLMNGRSGIEINPEQVERGFRSHVAGTLKINPEDHIDRKLFRFMGSAAAYTYLSMKEAIEQSGLTPEQVSNPRTGLIVGSGGSSCENIVETADIVREKGVKRVGPYMVTRTMGSTTSACLATPFGIKGINFSISSACATSAHCIGSGVEQIQFGKQDIVFAGGGEELHWSQTAMFDAMGALSSKYNDTPHTASRPFDATRDGFVISGGGGVVVLEELEHALARGANILAEVVGYGATSDGYDMVQPSGEGALRCMKQALATVDTPIDYVNTHGTSTPAGDMRELESLAKIFTDHKPFITSTKSLTGHSLGAAGSQEAIYSLLMMQNRFIAASANLNEIDPKAEGVNLLTEMLENVKIDTVLSNSFGFGGTNASLVMRRYQG